ncbi:thiamine pyrophosphate-dependent enzyme [Tropicimonas sediminicola]|uniref:3D-(3,5/4)-trihydroxycyclohexane-1,2-dione acylhydrolase (Decyclizing) n=1 Tax=Tropicimonas sediminicola TaxID=1031541 RepID=A0A239M481_9RHOB|nr:thiamine pyrophosphate-dependent enzyme [Tropicimonas sediminicola]SNT37475.1 3D-(3,5/4)-trihydroxycyclohexane-1,2-dione acylhydrolase (decyclizing) [Tropicimonas sediminicola]
MLQSPRQNETNDTPELAAMRERARALVAAGGPAEAIAAGALPAQERLTLSEGLVLGLLRQGVRTWFAIFGHGSTDLGNVLRIYEEEAALSVVNCRNEVEMAHAATAHAWVYGETPAVVTSIGPGGLQAMAGSLAAASNGVGVYHIYGDETTWGEGYNMQQVPKPEQGLFGRIAALMGHAYTLHTPEALRECLRRGTATVHHPYRAGPFYILLPINTQPQQAEVNLATLPGRMEIPRLAPADAGSFEQAASLLGSAERPVIKAGGGTRGAAAQICRLAEHIGAAVVLSPGSTGVLPDAHPQNMHVGGSKGSISGNFAMEEADLVIFAGSRGVCQADCSGVGYPKARAVININGDFDDVSHYANTVTLPGDIAAVAERLIAATPATERSAWLSACAGKKVEWGAFRKQRLSAPPMMDAAWGREVLTQPAAIGVVSAFAKAQGAIKFFDAGDVQANGFQIVEDEAPFETFTETGASYMGYAVSALLGAAGARAPKYGVAFTGDGSFMMNPQILIDAVEHSVRGMIALFDNRRMAAITGLQYAQYGVEFRTNDSVAVDYVQMASSVSGVKAVYGGHSAGELRAALETAHAHDGLSLVHIPVYNGRDPISEMGAYGSWNVGNWVDDVQSRYLQQTI